MKNTIASLLLATLAPVALASAATAQEYFEDGTPGTLRASRLSFYEGESIELTLTPQNGAINGIDRRGFVEEIYDDNSGERVYSTYLMGSYTAYNYVAPTTRTWQPIDYAGRPLSAGQYMVHAVHYDAATGEKDNTWFHIVIEVGTVDTTWTRFVGEGNATGHLTFEASLSKGDKSASGWVSASAGMTLLGTSVEVFKFEAGGTMREDQALGSDLNGLCRVAGNQLLGYDSLYFPQSWESSYSTPQGFTTSVKAELNGGRPKLTLGAGFSHSVIPSNRNNLTIWVAGIVPVTVTADAGLYGGLAFATTADPFDRALTFDGGVTTKIFGTLSFGFGIPLANTGIYGNVDLLNSTTSFPIKVDLDDGSLSGNSVKWEGKAAVLSFGVFAVVDFIVYTERWSVSLASWSSPEMDLSFPLN